MQPAIQRLKFNPACQSLYKPFFFVRNHDDVVKSPIYFVLVICQTLNVQHPDAIPHKTDLPFIF